MYRPEVPLLAPFLAAVLVGGEGAAQEIGAACRACHPAIVESYRQTGMARALQPIGESDLALLGQLAGAREPDTGFGYHFEVEGATARIVETWSASGPSGTPSRVGEAELSLAIGAGLMDRSFAAARGGMLWFAPLEVLTGEGGERRAVLAPAHEQVPGTRFAVPITGACLRCHTDRPPPADYPANLAPADWVPSGVSCGACHGDVAGHVRWQEAGPAERDPAGRDPVAVAWAMGRVERVSICARCHLQGDARIALTEAGRGLPPVGEDLLEHVGFWGGPERTTEIGFVSQVERLVQSRCFTATADWGVRALSCETCHDPHRSGFAPTERARVRAACGTCHASETSPQRRAAACDRDREAQPAAGDCVSCHMRRTPVFDLSGVQIHDHRIERRPPPPSSFERIRSNRATFGLERFAWPGARPPLDGDPGLELMAYVELGRGDAGLERIDSEPAAGVSRLPAYHHARGVLLEGRELERVHRGLQADTARLELGRRAYARALELDPDRTETALRLAPLTALLGRPEEALALIEGVVARHPRAPEPLHTRALVHLALRDTRAAARDCEAAFEILPRAALAAELAELHDRLGQGERALEWRAAAARLDPSGQ